MPHMGGSSSGARRSVGEFSPLCFSAPVPGRSQTSFVPAPMRQRGEEGETRNERKRRNLRSDRDPLAASKRNLLALGLFLELAQLFRDFPPAPNAKRGTCASLDPPLVLGIRGNFFSFSPLSPPLFDPLSWPGEFFDGRIWVGFTPRRGALENGREEEETVKPFNSLN